MLQTKEIISTKYAVPGYISTKHIRGHEYKYLQLRGYDGKIKSIYLAGEGLKVCENALNIQKALKNNENISAEYKKLLDGATGLSLKKCLLFKIIWKENKYVIRIYNGKEITEMPMIHICEWEPEKIGMHLEYASAAVDDYAVKNGIGIKVYYDPMNRNGKGITRSGIKYKYEISGNEGIAYCNYKRKKISVPFTAIYRENWINQDLLDMSNAQYPLQKEINRIEMEEAYIKYKKK